MTGHDDTHHVSHDRYEQLKADYCRRCGIHFDAASAHLHEAHHDEHP